MGRRDKEEEEGRAVEAVGRGAGVLMEISKTNELCEQAVILQLGGESGACVK